MAEKLALPGAVIRYANLRPKDGANHTLIHMTSDLPRPVAEELGWEPALDSNCYDEMKLSEDPIRLTSIHMKVDGLKQELDIAAEEMRDFKAVRVKDKERQVTVVELRFIILTTASISYIDAYLEAVGQGKARLVCSLQAEQQKTVEEAITESQQQDELFCEQEAGDAYLEEDEEEENDGPALASRAQMEVVN